MSSTRAERRAYISEAFHSLNQPITSLHCILELALARPRSAEEYRQRIAEALENAGSVLRLARSLREVVEADDPSDNLLIVPLQQLLQDAASELEGLAELRGCSFQLQDAAMANVTAEPVRLKRVLNYVMEAMLYEAAPNQQVKLSLNVADAAAVIGICGNVSSEPSASRSSIDERLAAMHWSTAIQTLQAIGGGIKREISGGRVAYYITLATEAGESSSAEGEHKHAAAAK
jgi:two-component system, OmpR family, sensor kinase